MHLFLEKGMKGGISCICNRYSSIKDKNTIMYWDFDLNISENSP